VENAVTAGSDFVELYALAILPRLLLVTLLYQTLLELAVDQDVTAETKETIIKRSGFLLVALGVTCDDVGTYKEDESPNAMTV
jgi:hypothetical protein